jgi:anaerobic magnesium-protoporphyrin IX monomethyl ester cyclase
MKILFINPPSVPFDYLQKSFEGKKIVMDQTVAMPMGILYLCSVTEEHDPKIDLQIIDIAKEYSDLSKVKFSKNLNFEEFLEQCLNLNEGAAPDVVGISILFSTAHKTSFKIGELVRKKWPESKILVGGMHATNEVEGLLASNTFDYVVRGEGEIGFIDFIKQLQEKKNPEVSGFISREKLKAGLQNEVSELPENLDNIPLPAWHLLNMSEYIHQRGRRHVETIEYEQNRVATVVTSRGCPFFCTFCASHTVHGRKMRYRSSENIIEELDILNEKYQTTTIVPEDDLFAVNKPRFLKLADAIEKRNYDFEWQFSNGLSVAVLDDEVIDAMMRLGMYVANIAIESGSEYVQKHIIRKNCNLKRAVKVVEYCRRKEIYTRTLFILGFPGETLEQMHETIEYASNLKADWTVISIAAPLVGTEMFQQLLDREEIDSSWNWDNAFFQERGYDTKEVSAEDLKKLVYDANISINFFNNTNFKEHNFQKAMNNFSDVLSRFPWHIIAHYSIGLCHQGLGDIEKYNSSLQHAAHLIETDKRSKDLYENYKLKMPELKSFLKNKTSSFATTEV